MPDQLTRQEQLFGIRDAEFGTLEAENARLYPFFRAVRALTSEAKVDPTDDGLRVVAVDGANVGMVDATVTLDGDVPDETFGVNIRRLAGQLQNKPRDTTVAIECALPTGLLRVEEQYANGRVWNVRERVGFLDPDSIRERPDLPDLEFDAAVELKVAELSSLINRLPDDRPVELVAADGELSIGSIASGSDDEAEYNALATTAYEGDTDAAALYPHGYLTKILTGTKATGAETVALEWSEEFPLHVVASGEYVDTEWFLAPRIRSD